MKKFSSFPKRTSTDNKVVQGEKNELLENIVSANMKKFSFPKRDDDQTTSATTSCNCSVQDDENTTFSPVDLKLPSNLTPLTDKKFKRMWKPFSLKESIQQVNVFGGNIFAVGSSSSANDVIYFKQDTGLFQCVHEAWMNHWNLRTSPEDWWQPIACQIAHAVSDADAVENQKIREFFVTHQGKETVSVKVNARYLEEANYEDVFQQFSRELHSRIKVPEYATEMQNDFSTTKGPHQVASQVNLMASLKEFFEYKMVFDGCGIKAVEMYGCEADWDQLNQKLNKLKEIMEPIEDYVSLDPEWWDHVFHVFQTLALTRKDPSHPQVVEFWSEIITKTKAWERGTGAYGMGPRTHQVDAYDGWLIPFLTGDPDYAIKLEDLRSTEDMGGLNSVPLDVEMTWRNPPVIEETKLIDGVLGFELHPGHCTSNGVPSLQPVHAWAMMLCPDSKLPRKKAKHSKVVPSTSMDLVLPPGWKEIFDPSSGVSSFMNDSTYEITWERPVAADDKGKSPCTED